MYSRRLTMTRCFTSHGNSTITAILRVNSPGLLSSSRQMSVAQPRINHYTSLGLTSKATHAEIKAAYYKLSKVYHPDLNKDSTEASAKFREITAAYEVLGNLKLRKLYDRGLLSSHGVHNRYQEEDQEQDLEAEIQKAKFYSSRHARSKAPPATGRTTIYDFDAWSRAHYGDSLNRRAEAKAKHKQQTTDRHFHRNRHHTESLILFGFLVLVSLWWSQFSSERDLDTPKTTKQQND